MEGMPKGAIYRCTKQQCGAEVQVIEACHCGDECHLTCCGERMEKK